MVDLKGKTVLLAGAGKGIGAEMANLLKDKGANLILVSRNLSIYKNSVGKNLRLIEMDFTNTEDMESLEEKLEGSDIDVLINMAAIGLYKNYPELSVQDLEYSLKLNVIAPFQLSKIVYQDLAKSEIGLVLNIGSGAGTMPFAGRSAYCASKFALRGLSLSISEEQEGSKPHFCLVTLGSTMTTFGGKSIEDQKQKVKEGRAIFPPEYVAEKLLDLIKSGEYPAEIVLYPSEHGFGDWSK